MKKFLDEFKAFAMRGNVLDLAIGVIIGLAFGAVVSSLVKDIIMPPIGVLLGDVDFSNLYIDLRAIITIRSRRRQDAGAATITMGCSSTP